jgi:isopentenyl phosphate kinase
MVKFLKLGGSLITDKDKPYTAHRDVIARIAQEVATALQEKSDLHILLGHGSGSLGISQLRITERGITSALRANGRDSKKSGMPLIR